MQRLCEARVLIMKYKHVWREGIIVLQQQPLTLHYKSIQCFCLLWQLRKENKRFKTLKAHFSEIILEWFCLHSEHLSRTFCRLTVSMNTVSELQGAVRALSAPTDQHIHPSISNTYPVWGCEGRLKPISASTGEGGVNLDKSPAHRRVDKLRQTTIHSHVFV